MELEKYYITTIKSLFLTKFKCLLNDKIFCFKFSIYFSNSYMTLLSMIILNLLSTKKVSLIYYFKGNLGYIPVGAYFFISELKFLQKFSLIFLGVENNLATNYAVIKNFHLILPLSKEFNDLFELNSLGESLPLSSEAFYFFTFNFYKQYSLINYEFILRFFKIPIIIN